MAFTILGMGVIDAVITQILKDTKNANKVILLRVSMYAAAAFMVVPEIFKFMNFARSVLAQ
jgi:hypothetical protein